MEYMPYRHNTDKLQVHTCGTCLQMLPAYYFCEGPQLFVVQKFLDHPTKPAGLGTGLRVQIILADLSLEAACKGVGIATVASLPLFLPSSKMQQVSQSWRYTYTCGCYIIVVVFLPLYCV